MFRYSIYSLGLLVAAVVVLHLTPGPSLWADCGAIPIVPDSYEDDEWFDDGDDWDTNGWEDIDDGGRGGGDWETDEWESDDWDSDDWDSDDEEGFAPYDEDEPYDDDFGPWDEEDSYDEDGFTPYDEDDAYEDAGEWEDWSGHAISKARIQEPTQKAVIAWNGREQLMVLQTEIRGTQRMKMMEIIPLPGRPTVTEGDRHLFNKTMRMFRTKHGLPFAIAKSTPRRGPGGVIIEEVEIGNHQIAVAQVLDARTFISWADGYVKTRVGRNAQPAISARGRKIITAYLNEGYRYWVFDLIDVDTDMRQHVAIQYRFPTNQLYYPMRITRTSGTGDTHVQLLIITQQLLRYFKGIRREQIDAPASSVRLAPSELRSLSTDIAGMFGGRSVQLRLWELRGPIQSFTGDLQARATLPGRQPPWTERWSPPPDRRFVPEPPREDRPRQRARELLPRAVPLLRRALEGKKVIP